MASARGIRRRRARTTVGRIGLAGAAALGALTLPSTPPAGATDEARPPMADPDTFWGSNYWFTYGTTVTGVDNCGNTAWNVINVPVIRHSTSSVANACITADAMPSGAGSWAASGSHIWAPSISYFSGTYFLHYSAMKPGGQWCIGRATSSSPLGPFGNQQEFACPPGGRWAIDPDVYVSPDGVFLTYRDDYITTGNQTGISGVALNSSGHAVWNTRKDLLLSTDVGWDYASRTGTHVVENPSLFTYDGRFYLMFSGNDFASNKYSIGIADCGETALPASRCKPLVDVNRPYFGYSGSGLNPVRTLPGDHPGPGGMSSTTNYKGTTNTNVSWHWWRSASEDRRIKTGVLYNSGGYFNVAL